MSLLMILRIAFKALNRNKMRTALTMLGMIIGVGRRDRDGRPRHRRADIDRDADPVGRHQHDHGQRPAASARAACRMGQGQRQHARAGRRAGDRASSPACSTWRPQSNTRGQIVAGNLNWDTQVQGTDVDMPLIRSWPTTRRRVLHDPGRQHGIKVAVLGSVLRDQLFSPDVEPVGQIIRISHQPFTVVGVMASRGQQGMGQDQDDQVFVPYTTVMKKLRGITFIQQVTVSAASASETTKSG